MTAKSAAASALLLNSSLALAAPAAYVIDSSHSEASFRVKHMVVATVRGTFGKLTGTVSYDPSNLAATTINASVDATTINTREPKRDEHLKSADFFDVAKFPTLTFKSKSLTKKGDRYALAGDLTIRGITKTVTFDVAAPSPEIQSPFGTTVIATSATARINRKDFGLVWNKPLQQAGQLLVGDDVDIQLDLELTKK